MISRSVIEQALIPSSCGCARVSMMRGDVRSPGLVATEPDDQQGSPVDGQALDGSGAVLSIDGHRIFIPYAPTVPQELAERVEQAVQQATTAQEATNSTHVVAESADIKAGAAIEAATTLETELAAAVERIDTAQAAADTAATEAGQALQGLAEALVSQQLEYAVSDSATVPPTTGWSTDSPAHTPGSYIWQRVRVFRANGDEAVSEPVPVTGNAGPAGPAGSDGTSVTIEDTVPTAADLPTGLTAGDAGKGWITANDGHLHVWTGTAWTDVGEIRGPQGESGEQGVSITSVTSFFRLLPTGSSQPATPSGVAPAGWTSTEPEYVPERELWRSERIALSNDSYTWTTPQKSSAYAAAVHVANLAEAATQGLVKVQESDPGHYPGRIWYQTDATGGGIGIKVSIDGAWVSYMLVADQLLIPSSIGSVLIANGAITGPKLHVDALDFKQATGLDLTSGTITGALLRTAESGPRLEITTQGLTRWRSDGEGGLIRSVNIGGSDADELALYDAQGQLLSGLMSDGSAAVRGQLAVGDLRVGGDRLEDLLDPAPKGVVALHKSSQDSPHAGTAAVGLARLNVYTSTDRMYRLSISGMLAAVTAGDQAQLTFATWQPTGGSIQYGNFTIPSSRAEYVYMEHVFRGLNNGQSQFGVRYANVTANRGIYWWGRSSYPVTFMLEDLGAAQYSVGQSDLLGGTPISPGTTVDETPAATHTKTYNAAWTRSWRGGTVVSDYLHHGYHGGLQRYSMVGFPAQVATDLAGATINKVEVYLDNQHWWGATGTAHIGRSTHASAPASPQGSGGNAFAVSGWAKGQARWVTAPDGWWTSSHRAITLGENAGTGTSHYGKFTNALSAVKLRVTYSK